MKNLETETDVAQKNETGWFLLLILLFKYYCIILHKTKNFLKKCRFLGCQKTDLKTVLYSQKCLYGVYNAQKTQNFPDPAIARSGRYAPIARRCTRCPNRTGCLRSPKLDVAEHTRFAREICINSGDLRNLLFGGNRFGRQAAEPQHIFFAPMATFRQHRGGAKRRRGWRRKNPNRNFTCLKSPVPENFFFFTPML